MFVSICTQANYATAVAPAIYSISGKNGRAGYNMHAVPQYLSVRFVTEEKMFSINCAEPCLYRSLLKLIMLRLLPRPYTAYLARMAEQDIICTRFRNIYQCGHDRGKMFSINCAEPCLYRSVLKLIMLWLLPRPYTAYLARMAEQDIICTRYRNIYQCGS